MTAGKPRGTPRGRRAAAWLVGALAAFAPAASHACGACDEDKIAAAYDHGVVERAAVSGDVMVYCAVRGLFDAQRLEQVARRVRGVKPQSVRVSAQPAALSFAVDPTMQAPSAAIEAAQRSLPSGTSLTIVRLLTAESRRRR